MFSGLTNQVSSWMGAAKGEPQDEEVPTPTKDATGEAAAEGEKQSPTKGGSKLDLITNVKSQMTGWLGSGIPIPGLRKNEAAPAEPEAVPVEPAEMAEPAKLEGKDDDDNSSATGGADSRPASTGGTPTEEAPQGVGNDHSKKIFSVDAIEVPDMQELTTKAVAGAKSLGSFLYSAVNKAGAKVSETTAKIKKTVEENCLLIIPERLKATYISDKYLNYVKAYIKRYSRKGEYYVNIEGDIKQPWGNNVTVNLIFTEFLHNEYRRSFIEFHYKLCDLLLKEPIIGGMLATRLPVCPLPKSILGEFNREQDAFIKGQAGAGGAAVPPWAGAPNEAALKDECLSLATDRRNFVRAPPAGVEFDFDYDKMYAVAVAIMAEDPNLEKMRFDLVPKVITEENFWRNYFYRLSLICQANEADAAAGRQLSADDSQDDDKCTSESFVAKSSQESIDDAKRRIKSLKVDRENDDEQWEKELEAELKEYEVVAGKGAEGETEGEGDDKRWERECDDLLGEGVDLK